jgi:hypothetical protein
MSAHDAAARATTRLRAIRDELELAGRPPGAIVEITRQQWEAALNDIGVIACAIRELAGGVS